MYDETDRYYRSSGRVPFGAILLMQLAGGLTAALCAAIYAAIEWWNPFIYLTFLATFVFGFATGYAVNAAARIGKVRSRMFTGLIGTAAGILGVYLTWVFYSYCLFRFGLKVELMLWNPLDLWDLMRQIMENPVWEMRGFKPEGWMLAVLWLLEAGIIIGTSAMAALADDKPFCDPCDTWTDSTVSGAIMPVTDPEALRRDLEAEKYGVLDDLMAEPASPTNFYQAMIHSCPRCEESNFLTVSHVTITTDSEGNPQSKAEPVVKYLRIPFALAEHLKTAEGTQEEILVATADETPEESQGEAVADAADTEDGTSGTR
jgi:hypothetical protein